MKIETELKKSSIPKCSTCGKEYKKLKYKEPYEDAPDKYVPHCRCGESYLRNEFKQEGQRKIKVIRRYKSSIGIRYRNKTFSNYDKTKNPKAYEDCLNYARNIGENIKQGKGLFLSGSVGTGKTHLLGAIIDYTARVKKQYICYYNVVSLLNAIRFTFKQKYTELQTTEEITTDLKRYDVLMIDDLGTENLTDWASEILFDIIDYRYSNLRATIISTNLTDVEIKERVSERMMSRIYEMSKGVKFTGQDQRV